MANTNIYVDITNNNSALVPQSVPASYPILVSTNAYQNLSALIQQYTFNDPLYIYYGTTAAPVYNCLQRAFQQSTSVDQVWGYDLETTYDITFLADGSLTFNIQWLDIDGNTYTQLSSTVANLAALVTYINTNITTVTASLSGLVLSIEPNSETLNQLVRINFPSLGYDAFVFEGQGAPASYAGSFGAIIELIESSTNFYCYTLESTIFLPLLNDNNSTKITAQIAFANLVEATNNAGDNRKVAVINTQDTNNLDNTNETCLFYQMKQLNLQRSIGVFYPTSGLVTGAVSLNFAQSNGSGSWAEKTITGIVASFLTSAQLSAIYNLDSQGNLDPDCFNANYYTSVASTAWFYPGITPSGLPFDVTILSDNMAKACRFAQIQNLNKAANAGTPVGLDQAGINAQVAVIRQTVLTGFSKYLQPLNAQGDLVIINAPTIAQVQANPNLFLNRVLSGITINFAPSGSINKILETMTAVI